MMDAGRAALARGRGEQLVRLGWTFMNQGVVSGGTFAVQMVLAWELAAASYGVASLVIGGLLTLQLCNATLVFHPMAVRIATVPPEGVARLAGGSLALQMGLSLLLAGVAGAVLVALGQGGLALPVLAYFLAWQLHEGMRRGLLSRMRHRAALWGDLACYGGQALCLAGLALAGLIVIETAFLAMACCALLGAAVHATRLPIAAPGWTEIRRLAADYWAIGGMAALSSGMLAQARLLVVPWVLAALSGPAAAAGLAACMNIVNLTNPVLLGMGNIVPQAASRAAAARVDAWRAVGGYIVAAAVPVVLYSAAVVALPELTLRTFYGDGSPYAAHAVALQLLIAVNLAGFPVECVVAYLHGITRVRHATAINLAGAATAVLLAYPCIRLFGLPGGCAALLAANLVRLVVARASLGQVALAPVSKAA